MSQCKAAHDEIERFVRKRQRLEASGLELDVRSAHTRSFDHLRGQIDCGDLVAALTQKAGISPRPAGCIQSATGPNPIEHRSNDWFFNLNQWIMKIVVSVGPQTVAALHVHVRYVELEFERGIFAESVGERPELLRAGLCGFVTDHPVSDDSDSRHPESVMHRPYLRHGGFTYTTNEEIGRDFVSAGNLAARPALLARTTMECGPHPELRRR